MIPKLSAPLTKAVRTLEGIILAAAAVTPWIVSLVNPASLSHGAAAKWSVISGIALAASRTAIKAVTAIKSTTGITPESIDLDQLASNVAGKIGIDKLPTTADIKALLSDALQDVKDPSEILKQLGFNLPSDQQEAAAQPPQPVTPVEAAPAVAQAPGA